MILGRAAFTWAIAFALVHVYWVAGGGVGLPTDIAATRPRPLMLAAAAAVPLLATAGACALMTGRVESRPLRPLAAAGVATVAAFCLLHSVPFFIELAMSETARRNAATGDGRYAVWLYEPNWLVGGLLFTGVWLRRRRV